MSIIPLFKEIWVAPPVSPPFSVVEAKYADKGTCIIKGPPASSETSSETSGETSGETSSETSGETTRVRTYGNAPISTRQQPMANPEWA
eukprot:2620-Pyramimonas_sp.AAC.1